MKLKRGYVQVYTGEGKGKTTATFGLALRAICAGYKVYIGQFMKGSSYSELKAPKYLPNLTIEQFGEPRSFRTAPTQREIDIANDGLKTIQAIINSGEYDVVVLDEINIALKYNIFTTEKVLSIIKNKPDHVELILTGRYAKKEIIEVADLVTEMRMLKHYYSEGVTARTGIEK